MVLAGPSGCGKGKLLSKLLQRKELFYPSLPSRIKYFYKDSTITQSKSISGVEYINAKPTGTEDSSVIIIDDWMNGIGENDDLLDLFTIYSRHRNISVFLLVQNFYYQSLRNLTLNPTHIALFKSPRDSSFINFMARQMFPITVTTCDRLLFMLRRNLTATFL